MKRHKMIEGISFDLKQTKQDIEDIGGKEAYITRAKELYWNDETMPINEATKLKRINTVIDEAMAYDEALDDDNVTANAATSSAPVAAAPVTPKPETEQERKAREKREKEEQNK